MTRNNLYTAGGEFTLPSGEVYVGSYHVHVTKGAMVGATHVSTPHSSLTPINQGLADLIKTIQDQLRQEQSPSQITSSITRSSSGGSSGGGGGSRSSGGGSSPAPSY